MNPYDKSPVRRVEDFYGYKHQRQLMENQLDIGNEFLIVKGPPSTGKTSFLFITEQYAKENHIIPCKIKIGDNPTSYDFFNNMFKSILRNINNQINNEVTKEYLRIYQHIIRDGCLPEKIKEFNLEFPFNYSSWNKNGRSMDDFPEYDSIATDINNIITKIKLKESSNNKIILLIDDFQKLFGIDEFGPGKDRTNSSTFQIGAGDNITEIFRNLWDDGFCEHLQICIATYPELIESEDNKQVKFAKRCCQIIDVDKFNNNNEMYELFEKPLEKVPDHYWYKIFVKNDKSFIKEVASDYFKIYNEQISKKYFEGKYPQNEFANLAFYDVGKLNTEKELNEFIENINSHKRELIDKIFIESGSRPFYAKLQLKAIFDYFNSIEPAKDVEMSIFKDKIPLLLNSMIDLDIENSKWIKIYQAVCGSLQKTLSIDLYDKYTIERKYHLELFLEYSRFSLNDIVDLRNWDYRCFSLKMQLGDNYTKIREEKKILSEIVWNFNKSDRRYFGKHAKDIQELNVPKLESSIKNLKRDNIIEYNEADSIKYVYKPTIYEQNYMRYDFMSLAIRKHLIIDGKLESKEEIKALSYLSNFFIGITSYYLNNKPFSKKIEEIVEIIGSANIQYIDDDDDMMLTSIFFSDDITFYYLPEKDIIFYCGNYAPFNFQYDDGSHLVEKLLDEIEEISQLELIKKQNKLLITDEQKYALANKLLDRNKFIDIANTYIKNLSMMDYWRLGDIDKALEIESNEVNYYIESNKSVELINSSLNNVVYLSLCRSNMETAKHVYEKYKDYINSYLKLEEGVYLTRYNYLLLKIFLGNKESIEKLKELKKLLKEDDTVFTTVYFSSKDELSETQDYNLYTAADISLGYL